MWFFLLLSISYAIAICISTLLSYYYSSLFITGLRCLISGTLILLVEFIYNKTLNIQVNKYKPGYFLAIVFGFIIPLTLNCLVIEHLPATELSIIAITQPILIYLLAAYFFNEKLNKRQFLLLITGTILAFIAVIMEAGIERISLISWQEPIALFDALLLAIGWLSIERLVRLNESANSIAGIGFFLTGIFTMLLSTTKPIRFTYQLSPLFLLLILILVGDLFTTRIRAQMSKQYSATLLSLICIFTPFITALNEQIFKHTQYSYKFFLIIIPSLICFIAFYYEELRTQNKNITLETN